MADEEQLAILNQGVEVWNKWREKNPKVRIDLVAADLRGANLMDADLSGANLTVAALSSANLRKAHFTWADLSGAHLNGANLNEADLLRADLREADLSGADLSKAIISATSFADVVLSEVKGLEEVVHQGPSSIGIDTIYKSKGKIPEVFLRGCGVPENMITFMHSLVGSAIEFYSCFISYSSKDDAFAKRVHADLQSKGVRVWFAPEELKIGDKFPTKIDEAIRLYDKLMLILSENSINSPWVRREVRAALAKEEKEKRTVLFPIRVDDAFMDTTEDWADEIRRSRHVGDFRKWKEHDSYAKVFERLLRDLKAGERPSP